MSFKTECKPRLDHGEAGTTGNSSSLGASGVSWEVGRCVVEILPYPGLKIAQY